jgi:DNA polymerase-3 subunit delta'
MWERLVGQPRAIEALQRAIARPVHAYLLVGPTGSGIEDAARCLAVGLIGGEGDERAEQLVFRRMHPDVVEVEPEGTFFLARQADDVIEEASRAPVEGTRKVIILREIERMNETSSNRLLKTFEEPPGETVFVLTTSMPDEVLPTIRSRCQRIDFEPVVAAELEAVLRSEGVDAEQATLAAELSGGQLARARALAGPMARVRRAFAAVPAIGDGTGSTAARLGDELDAEITAAIATVTERHGEELAEFEAEMERYGYQPREAQRLRRRIEERQKREAVRARRELLFEGITAIESTYRDALAGGEIRLNTDMAPIVVSPRAAADALDACREAREAFLVHEKGVVRLQYLLMSLPPARKASMTRVSSLPPE